MNVIRAGTGPAFLQRAEAYLVTQEAANCLVLGIPMQLALYPRQPKRAAYMATVEIGEQVLAAAVMTPPQRLVLAATESREALAALAADVASFERIMPGVSGPVPACQWFAEAWQRLTGDNVQAGKAMRVYEVSQVVTPSGVAGQPRRAGGSDRELLLAWLNAFDLEVFGTMGSDTAERVDSYFEMSTRGMYVWEDGGAAVCMAGYSGYTPHGARVGPVYTPPGQRGRGYGSALTAWLSQYLLNRDRRFCCLYTDLDNPTSNHIYQTIGYAPVCDVTEYDFTASAAPATRSLS